MVRPRAKEEVELNVAAMLDMAFQLLTFFILTFRSSPLESQIAMHMPPAVPMVPSDGLPPGEVRRLDIAAGVQTLTISLGSQSGGLDAMSVQGTPVKNLPELRDKLAEVLQTPGSPFEQVVLQVSEALQYGELMRVMGICSEQTLADGNKLRKLSFVAMGGPR